MEKKKIWLILICAVLVYLVMIIYADFNKLTSAIIKFQWPLLFALFGLTILNYLIRFFKWDFFLKKVNVKLSLKDSMFVFLSGLSMIITPSKIGEIWKGWLIKDISGDKLGKTIPVVIVERITDVIGLAILSIIGILFFYQEGLYLILIIIFLIIAGLFLLRSEFVKNKIISLVEKRTDKYSDDIKTIHVSFNKLIRYNNIISMSVLSAFAWFFECIGLYLVVKGFSESVSILKATFVFSFSSLAGAISMIPGGLGVAEGSISALLQLYGLSPSIAVGSSIIVRFGTLWFGAIFGMIIYLVFRKRIFQNRKKFNIEGIMNREN